MQTEIPTSPREIPTSRFRHQQNSQQTNTVQYRTDSPELNRLGPLGQLAKHLLLHDLSTPGQGQTMAGWIDKRAWPCIPPPPPAQVPGIDTRRKTCILYMHATVENWGGQTTCQDRAVEGWERASRCAPPPSPPHTHTHSPAPAMHLPARRPVQHLLFVSASVTSLG